MRRTFLRGFCVAILFPGIGFGWNQTLSERASNPITNLAQLQFENDYTPKNYGTRDSSNSLSIKPVIPISRTDGFPFEQLIRFKFVIPTLPNSATTTRGTYLGDTQFFDLFIQETEWGRWGLGPMMIFPTATKKEAGQGKWQLGPALGLSILKFQRWQIGFLAQNPISIGGDSDRPKQNYLLFQPFITYHFLKNAYFTTNPIWTFNWLNHTRQIPLNFGLGYTFDLFGYVKLDTALQYEFMAYQNAVKKSGYVNQSTIQLSINLLFEEQD